MFISQVTVIKLWTAVRKL